MFSVSSAVRTGIFWDCFFTAVIKRQTVWSFHWQDSIRGRTYCFEPFQCVSGICILWHFSNALNLKGELKPEISLLHMKVLTSIKAKSNVSPSYVQCCTGMRRSKTKTLMNRAPPSWIEFDVVTSHHQTRQLQYDLWLLISTFLRLLICSKSQKNNLRVSSNRFK